VGQPHPTSADHIERFPLVTHIASLVELFQRFSSPPQIRALALIMTNVNRTLGPLVATANDDRIVLLLVMSIRQFMLHFPVHTRPVAAIMRTQLGFIAHVSPIP
jgi:hypothetical protein